MLAKKSSIFGKYAKKIKEDDWSYKEVDEADPGFAFRHKRLIDEYVLLHRKRPKHKELEVILHYGLPGSGKTRAVYDDNEQVYAQPISQQGSFWFDGYEGDKLVLFDDFSGQMPLVNLLRVLDCYPTMVPTKGGHKDFLAEKIYLTSNIHPYLWYNWLHPVNRTVQKAALKRRIHKVVEFIDGVPHQLNDAFWNEFNTEQMIG